MFTIFDCGRLPAILLWLAYQFLQFNWSKIKIYKKRTLEVDKRSRLEFNFFAGNFSVKADFF